MRPEGHKAIARRFFEEVWNRHNWDAIDDIFAPTSAVQWEVDRSRELQTGRGDPTRRLPGHPGYGRESGGRRGQGLDAADVAGYSPRVLPGHCRDGETSPVESDASRTEGSWRIGPSRTSSASCKAWSICGMTYLLKESFDVQPLVPADGASPSR